MKLVLLADGHVGEEVTDFLLETYADDIELVVTKEINSIYNTVKKSEIPVRVFDSEDSIVEKLNEGVDLGVMAWWPKILKKPLLNYPRLGFVNTHPSLLPYNRGKHYNFWALVEQVPFGVTLHCVDQGIDTGNIIAQSKLSYDWCDTGQTLYKKAQNAMVELFRKTYPLMRTGQFESTPQSKTIGSFHHSSELDLASRIELDQLYRASDLLNLIRARTFEGYPGCWFEIDGVRYEISVNIRKVK